MLLVGLFGIFYFTDSRAQLFKADPFLYRHKGVSSIAGIYEQDFYKAGCHPVYYCSKLACHTHYSESCIQDGRASRLAATADCCHAIYLPGRYHALPFQKEQG